MKQSATVSGKRGPKFCVEPLKDVSYLFGHLFSLRTRRKIQSFIPRHHSPQCPPFRSGARRCRRSFLTRCLTRSRTEVAARPGSPATIRRLQSCVAL